jgi:outer membrane receptor protein involved in Fe transport
LIEIGFEGDFAVEDFIRRTDTLFTNFYVLDSMRYENYYGQRNDLDAYITVQHKFGRFTLKGGLRSENRIVQYKVINQPEHHDKKTYPGLFPSLHLSYATKNMHNFHLSYARRVSYPRTSQICSFIEYGEDSYTTGNPKLKSTFTNSVESGWTKYFEKFGSVGVSIYYRNNKNERNGFTDVIYNDFFGRYVSYFSFINSGESHQYGGDINITYKLKSFMSIRFNTTLYQYQNKTIFRDNSKPVVTDCFIYSFRLVFWAKLWKFLEINTSGNFRSKTRTIYSETAPTYSINCGLRSDFWKKKISVFLNVQDIFNWGRNINSNTNPYYIAYNSTKYNSRFISAGITFRFGKIEMESKARTGGNTE